MIVLEVDDAAAERILGRKLTALDRFLGLATDKAVKVVEKDLQGRLKLLRYPQNIQDSPGRTRPNSNPVRTRMEGKDGIVSLSPHMTSARSPVVQALFQQLGLEQQLVRAGLWQDPALYERDPATGRFLGRRRNHGYKSREGLRFFAFSEKVAVAGAGFSTAFGTKKITRVREDLKAWAGRKDKGTQLLRHTVRLTSDKVRIKLLMAPTVKFTRERILQIFASDTAQAMETP